MAKAQKNAAKTNGNGNGKAKATKRVAAVAKATTKTKTAKAEKVVAKRVVGVLVNPYRLGGGYWASVEALRTTANGKMVAFDKIVPAVIKAMGAEAYKAFKAKDARNENGKDATARIIQNLSVIARADYGKPLTDIGFQVKFDGRAKQVGIFKVGK